MAYELDPSVMDSYLYNTMRAESAGNPNARATTSSAGGLYGFTNPTFLQHARQFFPAGTSDQDILAQKYNPELQTKAMKALTSANAGVLSSNNIQATPGNLYAAHFLGAGDAKDVLTAPDDDPVSEYVQDASLAANKSVFKPDMTVGQFKQWANSKGEGAPNPDVPSPNAQNAQGQGLPGNMFGPPTNAPGGSLGQKLMQIGGILMSHGNPQGAQFIQTMLNNQRAQQKAGDEWSTDTRNPVTDKDGNQFYPSTNKRTGEVRQVPTGVAPKEEVKEPDVPKPTQEKAFQSNADLMDSTHRTVEAVNTVREHLLDGSLDVKWNDRAKAITANYLGQSSQASVDIKNAEAAINEQIKNILSQEKGSATNVKMVQAMKQILPSGGAFDKVTFMDALNRIADTGNGIYKNAARANSSLLSRYPTLAGQLPGPDGNPLDHKGLNDLYGQHIKDFQDFDTAFKPKFEPWKQQHFNKGKAPQKSLIDRFNSMFPE